MITSEHVAQFANPTEQEVPGPRYAHNDRHDKSQRENRAPPCLVVVGLRDLALDTASL